MNVWIDEFADEFHMTLDDSDEGLGYVFSVHMSVEDYGNLLDEMLSVWANYVTDEEDAVSLWNC